MSSIGITCGGQNQFVEVDRVDITDPLDPNYAASYTDSISDATLKTRARTADNLLNFNGPPANAGTRLVDLLSYQSGTTYHPTFRFLGNIASLPGKRAAAN